MHTVGVRVGVSVVDGVGGEEGSGGGVVEADAHEGELGEGVGGALVGAEPGVAVGDGGVSGGAVLGVLEVAGGGGAGGVGGGGGVVGDGGDDVAVEVGQVQVGVVVEVWVAARAPSMPRMWRSQVQVVPLSVLVSIQAGESLPWV